MGLNMRADLRTVLRSKHDFEFDLSRGLVSCAKYEAGRCG
jgi:hypothetical protein